MIQLTQAFDQLRKMGYYAQENFHCCQSCGWAAVGKRRKRVVFYHQQDKDRLIATGICALAWRGDGEKISQVFRNQGFNVHWTGKEDDRILVQVYPTIHEPVHRVQ